MVFEEDKMTQLDQSKYPYSIEYLKTKGFSPKIENSIWANDNSPCGKEVVG